MVLQSGDIIDPETGVQYCQPQAMWRVEGFDLENGGPFCYICRRVVLATGAADLPNRLGVPGELANPTWVLHDLRSLEAALDRLVEEEEGDREGEGGTQDVTSLCFTNMSQYYTKELASVTEKT